MKTPVFCGSLSVRQDSRRVRFELAKAEAYGGPAGCYRVRINRVWHDVDGKTAFLTPEQVVGMAVMGSNLALNMADHGYDVSVYNYTPDLTEQSLQSLNPRSVWQLL